MVARNITSRKRTELLFIFDGERKKQQNLKDSYIIL